MSNAALVALALPLLPLEFRDAIAGLTEVEQLVIVLSFAGCEREEVQARVGCSDRHVRRILADFKSRMTDQDQ